MLISHVPTLLPWTHLPSLPNQASFRVRKFEKNRNRKQPEPSFSEQLNDSNKSEEDEGNICHSSDTCPNKPTNEGDVHIIAAESEFKSNRMLKQQFRLGRRRQNRGGPLQALWNWRCNTIESKPGSQCTQSANDLMIERLLWRRKFGTAAMRWNAPTILRKIQEDGVVFTRKKIFAKVTWNEKMGIKRSHDQDGDTRREYVHQWAEGKPRWWRGGRCLTFQP